MKSKHPGCLPFTPPDEDVCIDNMARHYKWVLHGDQADNNEAGTDMYALPHNAYGDRVRAKLLAEEQEKQKNGNCVKYQ